MEKIPTSAASPESKASAEKMERLFRGGEISRELKPYDGQDVDSVTNEKIKKLESELYIIMMDAEVTWTDCVNSKLPWDPRFEMMKQRKLAANQNSAPAAEAA